MIGKAIISNSFFACLNYCLNPKKAPLILNQQGVFGDKATALAHQFDLIARFKPNVHYIYILQPLWLLY